VRCERKQGIYTLLPLTPHTVHPAFEDGTGTGFRNVGQLQFDAGEIPRRKYTTHACLLAAVSILLRSSLGSLFELLKVAVVEKVVYRLVSLLADALCVFPYLESGEGRPLSYRVLSASLPHSG